MCRLAISQRALCVVWPFHKGPCVSFGHFTKGLVCFVAGFVFEQCSRVFEGVRAWMFCFQSQFCDFKVLLRAITHGLVSAVVDRYPCGFVSRSVFVVVS